MQIKYNTYLYDNLKYNTSSPNASLAAAQNEQLSCARVHYWKYSKTETVLE